MRNNSITRSLLVSALLVALPALGWAQKVEQQPMNVLLTFHLIEADGEQRDDPEILPVVTELRKLFRFQGYRLASKSVLTATAWPPSRVRQIVSDAIGSTYVITADVEKANNDIRLSVALHATASNDDLINASVTLQNGKTVVLGTTSGSMKGQRGAGALILAVTPAINP
jgi:hypothetical protein